MKILFMIGLGCFLLLSIITFETNAYSYSIIYEEDFSSGNLPSNIIDSSDSWSGTPRRQERRRYWRSGG